MDATSQIRDALTTVQLEYVHMPTMKLTARQVQRLWSLSGEVCEAVLAVLTGRGFLVQASDGAYVRGRGCVAPGRETIPPLARVS